MTAGTRGPFGKAREHPIVAHDASPARRAELEVYARQLTVH